jgi:hypothetical protein
MMWSDAVAAWLLAARERQILNSAESTDDHA